MTRSLPGLLAAAAERDPDRALVVDETGTLTRGAAVELGRGMAHAFATLGVEPGTTVAVMVSNRREFLASWFGLACRGAIEVPVNPELVGDRLAHILNHCGAPLLVVETDRLAAIDRIADRLTALRRIVVIGAGADADAHAHALPCVGWDELELDPQAGPLRLPRSGDVEAVMYTSGSTGPPKGVAMPQGQHVANGEQPARLFGLTEDDTIYCCLPLHHNMAQGYAIMPALVSGATVHVAPRFDADRLWSDVRRHGATVLPFVGVMLVLLAKRAPAADDAENPLRIGYGVPIPRDLHASFEQRFGLRLVHCYGSTEATIVAWDAGSDRAVGSAGPVLDDYEVQVVDGEDAALPAGELGEICVRPRRADAMFAGYWRDAERTVRAWRNLWFHTGDRGRLDADGRLWFVDRMDDVVRRMGEFISAEEVEQVVMGHPDVQLAAAYGVASELVEQELMVTFTVQPGADVRADDLRAWCGERLARFAVPRFVRQVDVLPTTPTGKVARAELRETGVTADTDDARKRPGRSTHA